MRFRKRGRRYTIFNPRFHTKECNHSSHALIPFVDNFVHTCSSKHRSYHRLKSKDQILQINAPNIPGSSPITCHWCYNALEESGITLAGYILARENSFDLQLAHSNQCQLSCSNIIMMLTTEPFCYRTGIYVLHF